MGASSRSLQRLFGGIRNSLYDQTGGYVHNHINSCVKPQRLIYISFITDMQASFVSVAVQSIAIFTLVRQVLSVSRRGKILLPQICNIKSRSIPRSQDWLIILCRRRIELLWISFDIDSLEILGVIWRSPTTTLHSWLPKVIAYIAKFQNGVTSGGFVNSPVFPTGQTADQAARHLVWGPNHVIARMAWGGPGEVWTGLDQPGLCRLVWTCPAGYSGIYRI